jgi:cell division protein FtsI/penicillin-binding protein 2
LSAVREGMIGVVNSPAGTGQIPHDEALNGVTIAGKTGTAQASALTVPLRDMDGNVVLEDGHPKRVKVDPNNPEVKNWYIGSGPDKNEYAHHWFIGFAPADHPRIAFAVFAEYGGSGSPVATNIARDLVESCIKHGYVTGQ